MARNPMESSDAAFQHIEAEQKRDEEEIRRQTEKDIATHFSARDQELLRTFRDAREALNKAVTNTGDIAVRDAWEKFQEAETEWNAVQPKK